MKKYRVDTFYAESHTKTVFDSIDEAKSFGEKEASKGKIVFLLEELWKDIFDVIEQITPINMKGE